MHSLVEAMVLSMDKPLNIGKIAQALAHCGAIETADDPAIPTKIEKIVAMLNDSYKKEQRAFRIEQVAGGYRVMTRAEFAAAVMALHQSRSSNRLSKPAMETLAVVAYRQPVTRATLEAIRGVACGETLKTLMDKRLVTIRGRAEELGRPMLYGTTKEFLDLFGLASLKDLPDVADLAPPEPRIEPVKEVKHQETNDAPSDTPDTAIASEAVSEQTGDSTGSETDGQIDTNTSE